MKRRFSLVEYVVKSDHVERKCFACRKTIKNEPFAIKKDYRGRTKLIMQTRCWRCWHTADVTQLFLNKYPKVFRREKAGPWYYLKMRQDWLEFPSESGENASDW